MPGSHPVVTPSSVQLSQPCKVSDTRHPWLDGNSAPASAQQQDTKEDNSITVLAQQTEPAQKTAPHQGTAPTQEADKANPPLSTRQTLGSSHSARSSSSSSSSSGTATRDGSTEQLQAAVNATYASRQKAELHVSEVHQHRSKASLVNEPKQPRGRPMQRNIRCVSASPVDQARARWASPDRFVSQRPRLGEASPYHVNKPPSTLRGRELHDRARDPSANPFRSVSESRVREASRRTPSSSYGLRPPRFVPSFVHGDTAGPASLDPHRGPDALRHPSWTGFWNVGETGVAQFGQLRGVPTGNGRRLASGTNAPMHNSAFLDDPSNNDVLSSHEHRVALALDIDQAARMLTQPGKTLWSASSNTLEPRAMARGNGPWASHYSQNGNILSSLFRRANT